MPAYQLYVYEAQEKREALEQKICEQVDACTEVNETILQSIENSGCALAIIRRLRLRNPF